MCTIRRRAPPSPDSNPTDRQTGLTDRLTDSQTPRPRDTDRYTDTPTDTDTHRHTDTQTDNIETETDTETDNMSRTEVPKFAESVHVTSPHPSTWPRIYICIYIFIYVRTH